MRIGVVGGGQLGRMLGLAGLPLGFQFRFLEPSPGCPAAAVGEVTPTPYDDEEGLARFAEGLQVATFEFENVPTATLEWLAQRIEVAPGTRALAVAQDRIAEKRAFRDLGIPVQAFAAITTAADLASAIASVGGPCVLKTRRLGYDGKGQRVIRESAGSSLTGAVQTAWDELGRVPCILEAFVSFTAEVSMIAVRAKRHHHKNAIAFYPLTQNTHSGGILYKSLAPAPCDPTGELERAARDHLQRLMESLDYVGTLAVEFFVTGTGLVANEMAPRVHNSGHWTIDGSATSQFENHLRAITGLPLGPTTPRGAAAMVNLVGKQHLLSELFEVAGARVHLYGKGARSGRKLGHVTLCGEDPAALTQRLEALERLVAWG